MKKAIIFLFLAVAFIIPAAAQTAPAPTATPNFMAMISAIDTRSTVYATDFASLITMVSTDPTQGTITRQIQWYRRDSQNMSTMITLQPEIQRGQAHLRAGDNMWSYDPTSRQFTHVALSESFQGTVARNSDFHAFTFADDYTISATTTGTLGNFNVWIIDLTAKDETITFPYVRIWIDQASQVMLKVEDYSLSHRLSRTVLYTQYIRLQGHIIPSHTIMIDNVTAGRTVDMTVTNVSFAPLPAYVFTQAYIEQLAR